MSDESQGGGCGELLMYAALVLGLLFIFAAGAGSAKRGGDTTSTTTTTEVNIFSNNRILSPDTTVIVNSGNPQTDNRTAVDGERNNVQVEQPTTDPAVMQAAINRAIQDANAAMGVTP